MPSTTPTITREPAIDHIVERLARDAAVSRDRARQLMAELFDFLDDSAGSNGPRRPSPLVDRAWHTFILHTRDYAQFCQDRFGRFIHHVPEPGSSAASGGGDDCKSGESSCKSEGNCTTDCKSGESSCESEGNCTSDCRSDDPSAPDAVSTSVTHAAASGRRAPA